MSTETMEPVAWRVSIPEEPYLGTWFAEEDSTELGYHCEPLYTASQLQAAVAAERERCAKVVESVTGWTGVREVAAAIRQLGDEQ